MAKRKATACIKTKTVNEAFGHHAKPSDPFYYVLMLGGNVLMSLTKHRNRFGSCYESDSYTGDKDTIREWKDVVVARIERGYYGEVIQDMLEREMNK